jgi:hypothetical protein
MTTPWPHQTEGTRLLMTGRPFLLADDVGLGKTKQVSDAVFTWFGLGKVDALITVAPAQVRPVWEDPNPVIGEIAKHAPEGCPYRITSYTAKSPKLPPQEGRGALQIIVTNYEFLRRKIGKGKKAVWPNLAPLLAWAAARRTWLVLDESWSVQNPQAKQTHASFKLRQVCVNVTCLNGTPGSPKQTFAQFQILDERILQCPTEYLFKQRYCVMGGFDNREVVGYRDMADFERRTKPYVIRRENVLDIPERLPPQTIEVRLTPAQWKRYKALRDEAVLALDREDEFVIARQAGVKHLRLAQFLAGFVGGVESLEFGIMPDTVREIGTEKRDAVLEYIAAHDLQQVVVWCRFKPEMDGFQRALADKGFAVSALRGGQTGTVRTDSLKAFAPGSGGRIALVGQPQSGGAGVNLSAANVAIYATNTFSLKDRDQSEGRIDRPGQTRRPRYVDVIATGPDGQRTVDHSAIVALRKRYDVATWTKAMWKRALMGDLE